MCKELIGVYDEMLKEMNKNSKVLYYDGSLDHQKFDEMNFSDIEKYFSVGEKSSCIPSELSVYFSEANKGKERIQHVFSVYLLGIYCYDNINKIKYSFNDFIEKRIWKKANENVIGPEKGNRLRRDFLYLWYLTALFHDMGYPYESQGDNENSLFSFISCRKNMMSKDNLGFNCVLGIPRDIQLAAKDYFWNRRNNILFNEHLCIDHGFVGGFILYNTLKKLHQEKGGTSVTTPTDTNGLQFGMPIFQWYNVPSAWAIICHNIWLAEGGTGRADKYEKFGLEKLIYSQGKSPINLNSHPLLFLLDFVDTIDPVKRFGFEMMKNITLSAENDKLCISLKCQDEGNNPCCCRSCEKMQKLEKDLDFLLSDSIHVKTIESEITLSFSEKKYGIAKNFR